MVSSSSLKFQYRQQQQYIDDKFKSYNNHHHHGIIIMINNQKFCSSQIVDPISKYGAKTLTFLYHGCINLMLILLLVTKHKPLL